MMSSSAFAADPVPAPTSARLLPATKELISVAAVGLVCAAASANPVTALGIAACLITVAAKTVGKL